VGAPEHSAHQRLRERRRLAGAADGQDQHWKTSIGKLLRCSWEAVDAIVARVVINHIDDARLVRIGVDEISYKWVLSS
jgi:hypothetical protein